MKETMEKKENKKQNILSKIVSLVLFAVIIFAIVFVFRSVRSMKTGKLAKTFGYSFSTVVTPSMVPTINVNDVIIIKDVPFEEIDVDDIIVYYNYEQNINVVHRVFEINPDGSLTTLGDNNNNIVDTIHTTKDNYIGKVVKITKLFGLGTLINNNRATIFVFIIVCVTGIVIVDIFSTISNKREKIRIEKLKEETERKRKENEERREKMRKELLEELKNEIQNK